MSTLTPVISTSEKVAVGAAAALLTTVMPAGTLWKFESTVSCYVRQGDSSVVASAASGSMFLSAGESIIIEPGLDTGADFDRGSRLSVIRATGDGSATLTQMVER